MYDSTSLTGETVCDRKNKQTNMILVVLSVYLVYSNVFYSLNGENGLEVHDILFPK